MAHHMKGSTLKGKRNGLPRESRVCDCGGMVQRSRGLRSLTHGALPRDVIENVSTATWRAARYASHQLHGEEAYWFPNQNGLAVSRKHEVRL